jgi:hypothetical protein
MTFNDSNVLPQRQPRPAGGVLGVKGESCWRDLFTAFVPAYRQAQPDKLPFRPGLFPRFCGQSRTTIRARNFAVLIGRLWVGDS